MTCAYTPRAGSTIGVSFDVPSVKKLLSPIFPGFGKTAHSSHESARMDPHLHRIPLARVQGVRDELRPRPQGECLLAS